MVSNVPLKFNLLHYTTETSITHRMQDPNWDSKKVASVNASMQSTMSLVTFRDGSVYNKKDAEAARKKGRMVCDTAKSVLSQPDRDLWETSRSAAARSIVAPGTHAPPPMHPTLRWHPPVIEYLQEAPSPSRSDEDDDDEDDGDDSSSNVAGMKNNGRPMTTGGIGNGGAGAEKKKKKKKKNAPSKLSASSRLLTARRPITAAERLAKDSATVKSMDAVGSLHINGGQRDRPATAAIERPRSSAVEFKRRTDTRESQFRSKVRSHLCPVHTRTTV